VNIVKDENSIRIKKTNTCFKGKLAFSKITVIALLKIDFIFCIEVICRTFRKKSKKNVMKTSYVYLRLVFQPSLTLRLFLREKQRNRETEKQRNRETEKQRNRETEKQRFFSLPKISVFCLTLQSKTLFTFRGESEKFNLIVLSFVNRGCKKI
jgi:hypothetical protein